ncbi:MAG: hypothetical protein EON88_28170 [Brevundimonas sp.]|nr:MAG: hypothetical protein EON88_28170 [Brevundimonas sp.]
MEYLVVYGLGLVPLLILSGIGRPVDRWAVAAIVASVVVETVAAPLQIGGWRAGVALSNTALFLILWALAERGERWWLIFAAASQLLTVISHAWPWITPGIHTWSGVGLRRALWLAFTAFLFLGALEAWLSRRLAQEMRLDQDPRPDPGGHRDLA